MEQKLLAYLGRMLGEPVAPGTQVALSSTQRVQLISWLNSNGVPADINRFKSNLVSIDQILAIGGDDQLAQSPQTADRMSSDTPRRVAERKSYAASAAPAMLGLGVDVQAVSKMPEAQDYREDSFYKRNFSDAELSHAIEKAAPLETLAGIWAAKEAVLKAGAASRSETGEVGTIEIGHRRDGAPTYPGCLLSISHESGLAVAVCVRLG